MSTIEVHIPNISVGSVIGKGGSNIAHIRQVCTLHLHVMDHLIIRFSSACFLLQCCSEFRWRGVVNVQHSGDIFSCNEVFLDISAFDDMAFCSLDFWSEGETAQQ